MSFSALHLRELERLSGLRKLAGLLSGVSETVGRVVVVAVTEGKLDFGPWECIFYYELDGKRKKRALVKIIGE